MDHKDLIGDLRQAYADAWLAVYSYTYMAQTVDRITLNGGEPQYREDSLICDLVASLRQAARRRLAHQELLARRIIEMGGRPADDPTTLVSLSMTGYPVPPAGIHLEIDTSTLANIAKTALEAEKSTVGVYEALERKTAPVVCSPGSAIVPDNGNGATRSLVARLLAEEIELRDAFAALLERLLAWRVGIA